MKVNKIYFSPTKTTEQVVNAIAQSIEANTYNDINYTTTNQKDQITIPENDLAIIGCPVYSGRIPEVFLNRMQSINAKGTKAIILVVYGNRHYDDALIELVNESKKLGFNPIAAAAFIGVHSFSTDQYPVALGRPSLDDLSKAKEFAKNVQLIIKEDDLSLEVPGNFPYGERKAKLITKPIVDKNQCNLCGLCETNCPFEAISIQKQEHYINENLCNYCHACLRNCPQQAIKFEDERINEFSKKLHTHFNDYKSPEFFLAK